MSSHFREESMLNLSTWFVSLLSFVRSVSLCVLAVYVCVCMCLSRCLSSSSSSHIDISSYRDERILFRWNNVWHQISHYSISIIVTLTCLSVIVWAIRTLLCVLIIRISHRELVRLSVRLSWKWWEWEANERSTDRMRIISFSWICHDEMSVL